MRVEGFGQAAHEHLALQRLFGLPGTAAGGLGLGGSYRAPRTEIGTARCFFRL